MSKFRPLLAAPIDDESQLSLLQYPLIGSPKIDGVRVLVHPEVGPCTRSLKAVHNEHIRRMLHKPEYMHFDGEVVIGEHHGEGVFARTISAIQSYDGEPKFTYWIFDDFEHPDAHYRIRLNHTHKRAQEV